MFSWLRGSHGRSLLVMGYNPHLLLGRNEIVRTGDSRPRKGGPRHLPSDYFPQSADERCVRPAGGAMCHSGAQMRG